MKTFLFYFLLKILNKKLKMLNNIVILYEMKQINKFIIIKYDYINLNYYVFTLTCNYLYYITLYINLQNFKYFN